MRKNDKNTKLVPNAIPVHVRRTNDLTKLAAAIQAEVKGAFDSFRTGLLHAKRAGELLVEAHAICCHGEWLPWLKANCGGISDRTAQVYIQIADRWSELEAKPERVTDLSINQARRLLSQPSSMAVGNGPLQPMSASGAMPPKPPVNHDATASAGAAPDGDGRRKPKAALPAPSPKAATSKATPAPGAATPPTPKWEVYGPATAPTQSSDDTPPPKEDPDALLFTLNATGQRLALCVAKAPTAEHPAECAKALEDIDKAVAEIRKVLPHA